MMQIVIMLLQKCCPHRRVTFRSTVCTTLRSWAIISPTALPHERDSRFVIYSGSGSRPSVFLIKSSALACAPAAVRKKVEKLSLYEACFIKIEDRPMVTATAARVIAIPYASRNSSL